MNKLELSKPTLLMLYGFPGSGKSFFSRQFCEDIHAAHIQSERIRYELFDEPRYDKQENEIISHLMDYMSEEFLQAGVSVLYDMNASTMNRRRILRDLARKAKAEHAMIWFQIDLESAFIRAAKRDKRKTDDKYSKDIDRNAFEDLTARMQNPTRTEDFMVISGKHTYQTQRSAVIKKLYDMGLINPQVAASKVVKPGLVNLIPNRGRVDQSRRNIMIR